MNVVAGKNVLVVGLARTGLPTARCLQRRGAVVTVTDAKPPSAFQHVIPELSALKIGLELGFQPAETFLRHDLIVVSPGVPWDLPQLRAAREKGIAVVPEIEVASWFLTNRMVGITGTNGKTTTTALLGKMLEASGFPTFIGGNIGVPLIAAVDAVSPETILVVELSSFQLEGIQSFRPHVAVLLNLSPNHLDRHASFSQYVKAKVRIFSNLRAEDYAVLNADDSNVMTFAPALSGQRIFFSRRENLPAGVSLANGHIRYRVSHLERALLEVRDIALRGTFNLENVLAACTAACILGADFESLRSAVRGFQGVEHRIEFVGRIGGVEFFNDSKATSVDASAKALSTFARGVHLILGGKDKGAPYAPLRSLLAGRVRTVLLIGEAADRIAKELEGAVQLVRVGDLETAVREAFKRAEEGDVILLSPACASFDQFQDFEHRGRVFKQVVEGLAREEGVEGAKRGGKEKSHNPRTSSRAGGVRVHPKAPPKEVQGGSKSLEPSSIYEVGAEELAPSEKTKGQKEGEEALAEEAGSLEAAPQNVREVLEGELLPFEVPTPSTRSKDEGGHKASAARAGEPERESSGKD